MKTALIILICLIIARAVYIWLTQISFFNYKASIGKLYRRIVEDKNIPKGPVIFVPGIKGSVLKNAGRVAWLRLSEIVFGGPSLRSFEKDGVEAVGVFTGLVIFPFLAEYRPYFKITAKLACSSDAYFFYYDWRDYPDINSKKFGELVERVMKETGQKPSIIAHSMGGLIAQGYIKEHPENVNKVVYISVPFQPGVSYFDDVNDGVAVGLNRDLLSKDVLFSHPASYLLMPHRGSNTFYGHELMDATTWSDNKFSIFKEGVTVGINQFQRILDRVAEYHKLLDSPKTLKNDFLFVVADCYPTLYSIDDRGQRNYKLGDGRVSKISSYPLDNLINQETAVFCQKHDKQMSNQEILDRIFNFVDSQ